MKSLFSSFLIFLFLSACTSNPSSTETQTGDGVEIIDVANAETYEGTLDALIEDVYFVQLEASEEALFSEVSEVHFAEGKILILDERNNKVLAFDEEGNFLFKIDQKGDGPGEYKEISSMAYDYENKLLILAASGKFLWFDMQGDFVKEVKSLYAYLQDIAFVGDSRFVAYYGLSGTFNQETVRLALLDNKMKVISTYEPFDNKVRISQGCMPI